MRSSASPTGLPPASQPLAQGRGRPRSKVACRTERIRRQTSEVCMRSSASPTGIPPASEPLAQGRGRPRSRVACRTERIRRQTSEVEARLPKSRQGFRRRDVTPEVFRNLGSLYRASFQWHGLGLEVESPGFWSAGLHGLLACHHDAIGVKYIVSASLLTSLLTMV